MGLFGGLAGRAVKNIREKPKEQKAFEKAYESERLKGAREAGKLAAKKGNKVGFGWY